MASLDLARMQMATEGKKLLGTAIRLAEDARERIHRIPGLQCFGRQDHHHLDVTKLTIRVRDLGLSGFQVSQMLNTEYQVQAEMADPFHVLVIISIGDRKQDLDRLVDALQHIATDSVQHTSNQSITNPGLPPVPGQRVLIPRDAFLADHHAVPLRDSARKTCAEVVTIYPPGIALLVPGEVITSESIEYICRLTDFGATIDGLDEGNALIRTVK
jgi:lysine decarboxylase